MVNIKNVNEAIKEAGLERVLVLIISDSEPERSIFGELKAVFEDSYIAELLNREEVVTCQIISGSEYHLAFQEIYAIPGEICPLICVLGKNGRPTGLLKIETQCDNKVADKLVKALHLAVFGDEGLHQGHPISMNDKSINTETVSKNQTPETNNCSDFALSFEVDEGSNSVRTQCNLNSSPISKQPTYEYLCEEYMDDDVTLAQQPLKDDRVLEPQCNEVVCRSLPRREAPLPPFTWSRLHIILPDLETMHAAFSRNAILNDVLHFVVDMTGFQTQTLEISIRYPHHTFTRTELSRTLEDLGLTPSAVVIVTFNSSQQGLAQQGWGWIDVIQGIVRNVTNPIVATLTTIWLNIQRLFTSSHQAEPVDIDDEDEYSDDDQPPPQPPIRRRGNVHTLFDRGEHGDTVPSYNGNSTQLL